MFPRGLINVVSQQWKLEEDPDSGVGMSREQKPCVVDRASWRRLYNKVRVYFKRVLYLA